MDIRTIFKKHGDITAIITSSRSFSYAEMDALILEREAGLREKAIKPGDIVVLFKFSVEETVAMFFAALRVGALPAIIPDGLGEEALKHIFESLKAHYVFCNRNFLQLLRGVNLHGAKLYQGLPRGRKENGEGTPVDIEGNQFFMMSRGNGNIPLIASTDCALLEKIAKREKTDTGLAPGQKVFCAAGLNGQNVICVGLLAPLLLGATVIINNGWSSNDHIVRMLGEVKLQAIFLADAQCQALLEQEESKKIARLFRHQPIKECYVTEALLLADGEEWQKRTGTALRQCSIDSVMPRRGVHENSCWRERETPPSFSFP